MSWKFNSTQAVYLQIANRLRGEIANGKYPPETQIPTVRQLAFEAAVNPNTMQKALSVLESEGLLWSQGTVGRFITSDVNALEAAREAVRRDTVKRLLAETRALGISSEELIDYIKKEGEENEHTCS